MFDVQDPFINSNLGLGYWIGYGLSAGSPIIYFLVVSLVIWFFWHTFGSDNFRDYSSKYSAYIFILIGITTFIIIPLLIKSGILPEYLWY